MRPNKSGTTKSISLLADAKDLHADPTVSTGTLLGLWPGTNEMSFLRWRREDKMPAPMSRGKHSCYKLLAWLWQRKSLLEDAVRDLENVEKNDPIEKQRRELKFRREKIEFDRDIMGTVVDRREYEEAEAHRIALAIAFLQSFPDRLIMAGLMLAENKGKAMDLMGDAVDAFRVQIEGESQDEQTGAESP